MRLMALVLIILLQTSCSFSGNSAEVGANMSSQKEFKVNGDVISLYVLDTGRIQIKDCHYENCLDDDSSYITRFISILLSSKPADELLPVFAFLIRHPEGDYLIDTGADIEWNNDESWECSNRGRFVSRKIAQITVDTTQNLITHLKQMSPPVELKDVIITHGHFDHVGNLRGLNFNSVLIGQGDIDHAEKIGLISCKYLDGVDNIKKLSIEPVIDNKDTYSVAFKTKPIYLTEDKSLRAYVVAGHTPGSMVVVQSTDEADLLFIGDLAFTESGISEKAPVTGMHFDIPNIRNLHSIIRQLKKDNPSMIIIPSHSRTISETLTENKVNP